MAVIRRSPVEAVLTAIVSSLRGSTDVTGIATGGVYNNVPQGTPYPYVLVSSPTDRAEDTMGRFGAWLTVDVKAVSQAAGDQEGARILDRCIRTLNFQRPTLSEHSCLGMTWTNSERFSEIVAGVITRHAIATFDVWAEQSTS